MTTKIEWVKTRPEDGPGETWNPVRGCSRVSPGCDRCYAMGQAHRFSGPGKPYEGLTTIRRGKVDWAGMARLVPEQCEGRVNRDGQTDPVMAYYLLCEVGSDPIVADVLQVKKNQLHGMRDPKAELIEKLDTGGAHLKALAEAYLKKGRAA